MKNSSLYWFNPMTVSRDLTGVDTAQWTKIYRILGRAIGMVDRTETLRQPIRVSVYDRCRLPSQEGPSLSYDECCRLRARELWQQSLELDRPLGIMWSGGIDSTMIVVSFLREFPRAELKDRVRIITSPEAVIENPNFYRAHILPNFDMTISDLMPWLFDGQLILVSGECNDQLFGSDLIKNFLTHRGSDLINRPLNLDFIRDYVDSWIQDEGVTRTFIDAVMQSADRQMITLEKNTDFFWWHNFCYKWQAVCLECYALTTARLAQNIDQDFDRRFKQPFYETADFQRWSMRNPQVRYIDDWRNYKMEAKNAIYEFDHDDFYWRNKIKRGSLQTVFFQRALNEAVTDQFKILQRFNPMDYYDPNNDFV